VKRRIAIIDDEAAFAVRIGRKNLIFLIVPRDLTIDWLE
jgi:hypothetical protein